MRLNPDAQPARLRQLLRPPTRAVTALDEDDCAVVEAPDGSCFVFTTDFLNASPICIELGIGGPADLGWLLVGANLSDLCGTGASPLGLMVAITLSRDAEEEDFDGIMGGIAEATVAYDVDVFGGDTKLGPARSLCATAIGRAESRDQLFLRSKARPGQDLWVSGDVGSVSAAILAFSEGMEDPEITAAAIPAITRPRVPLAASTAAVAVGGVTGGTDLSDGLGADTHNLARTSGVGVELDVEAIPIAPWARRVADACGLDPWRLAFGLGGDFQFICSADPSVGSELAAAGLIPIGRTTDHGLTLVMAGGSTQPMPTGGHTDSARTTFTEENRRMLGLGATEEGRR